MEKDKYRKKLEDQFAAAKENMEKKRAEMSEIVQAIKADTTRSINHDPEALAKNMELSKAIQKYSRLKKRLD